METFPNRPIQNLEKKKKSKKNIKQEATYPLEGYNKGLATHRPLQNLEKKKKKLKQETSPEEKNLFYSITIFILLHNKKSVF